MEAINESTIFKDIQNVYGIEKCIDTIKNYAKYLKLRTKNNISIGNYNVLIKCKNEYSQIDQLVQAIIKLLKLNNIATSSTLYIEDRKIRNRYRPSELEDKEVIIIELASSYMYKQIKEFIKDNPEAVFIIIDNEEDSFWYEEFKTSDIFWIFELEEEVTEKDKTNYIKQVFKQNGIKIDSNCNLITGMSNNDYDKVQQDLMSIIIGCKSKNIDKVTYKVLEDLDKREYLRIRTKSSTISDKKNAMKELEALEGLDEVKEQIYSILNYIKVNKNRGSLPCLHMSFEGNPGRTVKLLWLGLSAKYLQKKKFYLIKRNL